MDSEALFSAANMLVMPGWLLLVFLPRWRYTTGVITSVLLPAVLGVCYVGLFAANFRSQPDGFAAFNTLAGVKSLFQNDSLLLAGWIHYLAFDLFVGSWEVRDAQRLGIHHLLVIPCPGLHADARSGWTAGLSGVATGLARNLATRSTTLLRAAGRRLTIAAEGTIGDD